jgi:hypothetical protein
MNLSPYSESSRAGNQREFDLYPTQMTLGGKRTSFSLSGWFPICGALEDHLAKLRKMVTEKVVCEARCLDSVMLRITN